MERNGNGNTIRKYLQRVLELAKVMQSLAVGLRHIGGWRFLCLVECLDEGITQQLDLMGSLIQSSPSWVTPVRGGFQPPGAFQALPAAPGGR